jgi:spore coat polysaccharide biosynthesis protein SpsF (cytidylyltransferase family)
MGSTRLPGKVLREIDGQPMLWHVVTRSQAISLVDEVVVATTTESQDEQIVDYCRRKNFKIARGSEMDVLDRYYKISNEFDADTVVRITSDCPLISPAIVDRLIRVFNESSVDFVSNKDPWTHPVGLQAEVMTTEALQRTQLNAEYPADREHVTRYIRRSSDFDKKTLTNLLDLCTYSITDSETILRWVVDYQSDLNFVRAIYDHLASDIGRIFGQKVIFELLERRPELIDMTRHTTPEALTLS